MAYQKSQEEIENEKMSKINAAGIINITLENLWKDSYSSMATGNYSTWNAKLDAVWLILAGDVKPNSKEEQEYNKIDLQIHEAGSLNPKKVGFHVEKNKESRNLHYLLLKKKALFLRRLQNSQGKGTAYVSEDEDDFD